MARALLICYRHPFPSSEADEPLVRLAASLVPDHVASRPATISRTEGLVSVIASPGESVRREGASFALGVFEPCGHWSQPSAPVPDGSFALFRADDEHVELVADAAAGRTIWYALTDAMFVASTSQRAVVAMLGDFRPNLDACAWLLSSGTLGPGRRGWDGRVERVPPAGRVLLRRAAWRLDVRETRIGVAPTPADARAPAERRRELQALVDDVVGKLDLDFSRWLVPLSGGVDSRGLVLALRRTGRGPIRCITWGTRAALDDPVNDARIARELAERLGLEHEYLVVEATREPRERFLERFLVAGEGRVDAIGGYLDGFGVWKRLHDAGVEGVVRGDEAFGWKHGATELDVRESVQLTRLDDVLGARAARESGLPEQRIPDDLARRPDESLAAWRDRLYQQFRLPVVLAALTDLKTPYVEVVNPFLYAQLLAYARKLPDHERTNKRLWRSMVGEWGPVLPYATRGAVPSPRAFMQDTEMLELTLDELASAAVVDLFGAALVRRVRAGLDGTARRSPSLRGLAARRSPVGRVVRKAQRRLLGRVHADPAALAFRMLIAARTCSMLTRDAAAFAATRAAARRAAGASR